ncbi:MAG: hypothetical protein ABIE22_01380 [archaeon]
MKKELSLVILLLIAGMLLAVNVQAQAQGNTTIEFVTSGGVCGSGRLVWYDDQIPPNAHPTTWDNNGDLLNDSTYCRETVPYCCPSGYICVLNGQFDCTSPGGVGPGCGCQPIDSAYCNGGGPDGGPILYCSDYGVANNCTLDVCFALQRECDLEENECGIIKQNASGEWWSSVNQSCNWTGSECKFQNIWKSTFCFNPPCDTDPYYYCERTTETGPCQGNMRFVNWTESLYDEDGTLINDVELKNFFNCNGDSRYYKCGFEEQFSFFNFWTAVISILLVAGYYYTKKE